VVSSKRQAHGWQTGLKTRKLSYRKDDRAMRRIYGCSHGGTNLRFFSPQSDTNLHCQTVDTGLVCHVVCLYSLLSSLWYSLSPQGRMARLSWPGRLATCRDGLSARTISKVLTGPVMRFFRIHNRMHRDCVVTGIALGLIEDSRSHEQYTMQTISKLKKIL